MLTKVLTFEQVGQFGLALTFNDGSRGFHDFEQLVSAGGVLLSQLQDPAYFARVFLDWGALTWPNGFDIAPEWLRRDMEAAGELALAA